MPFSLSLQILFPNALFDAPRSMVRNFSAARMATCMLPAICRQFAAMSTCRPSCSRLNFNERASPLLKGYVIERRSCDLAPMPCFLPLPVNLPIGTSIGVPTAMRTFQPSSARHPCREVIVATFLVIGRGGRLACLPPSQFRLARGRPCATVMASSGLARFDIQAGEQTALPDAPVRRGRFY